MYRLKPSEVESIKPVRFPPYWKPRLKIEIDEDKENAKASDQEWRRRTRVWIYTDGSDIDGGVGASAVIYYKGRARKRTKVRRFYLGASDEHTVYEAEVTGVILALELLRKELRNSVSTVSIALDNQAAIKASRSTDAAPAQYLMNHVHELLDKVHNRHENLKLTLRWVPGHEDIDGNEEADKEAKKAARQDTTPLRDLPRCLRAILPQSASKLRQVQKAQLDTKAEEIWRQSSRHARVT